MMQPLNSFDDLSQGQELQFGSFTMTEPEILDFARRFDPQPFHVDPERAKATIFGGLIASGLHTQAAAFGHILRTGLFEKVSLGGTEQVVRWPAPVRPGEEIAVSARVEELIPSRSKPDRGVAKIRYFGTRTSDGVVVLDILGTHFLKR
jgi:acyl dehydratase